MITNSKSAYQLYLLSLPSDVHNHRSSKSFYTTFNRIYRIIDHLNLDVSNEYEVTNWISKYFIPQSVAKKLLNITDRYQYRDIILDYCINTLSNLFPTLSVSTSHTSDIYINTDPRGLSIKTSESLAKQYDMSVDFGGYGILN